jgi:predicted aminopeptidase
LRGGRWRPGAGRRTVIRSRRYVAWLGDRSPVDGDPLADGDARDWAVRDYKRHLKAVERWKPASVNLALAALDSFYTQLELGRPVVRREDLPARALSLSSVSHCIQVVNVGATT